MSVAIVSINEAGSLTNLYNEISDFDLCSLEALNSFLSLKPNYTKIEISHHEKGQTFLVVENDLLFADVKRKINENVHEIKNVLTVVVSSVLILIKIKNKGLLEEKSDVLDGSLKDIEMAVQNVITLLNSLKQIDRELDKVHTVKLKDFIYLTTSELESVTLNSNIKLTLDIDIDQEESIVTTKGILLNQKVVNLFKNSIFSISESKVESPELKVEIKENKNKLIFKIKDNGLGIPEEDREKVFNEGFTTKGNKGSGVGLYLCKKGIEKSGGILKLVPLESKGACFYFELPLGV